MSTLYQRQTAAAEQAQALLDHLVEHVAAHWATDCREPGRCVGPQIDNALDAAPPITLTRYLKVALIQLAAARTVPAGAEPVLPPPAG